MILLWDWVHSKKSLVISLMISTKAQKLDNNIYSNKVTLSSPDSDREVDVGNQVKITTQGEVSYIGSFSSNNTVPIGQLPSNLFASSILRQRAFFDYYSILLGGFIQADVQI